MCGGVVDCESDPLSLRCSSGIKCLVPTPLICVESSSSYQGGMKPEINSIIDSSKKYLCGAILKPVNDGYYGSSTDGSDGKLDDTMINNLIDLDTDT